jgi:protein phosphatase
VILRAALDVGVATHTGQRRNANEDDYLLVAPPKEAATTGELFAVADGIGGAPGGAEASRAALRALGAAFVAAPQVAADERMRAGFRAAAARVFELSREVPALRDMGTTLTAVNVLGDTAVVGHVGDSRALLVRRGEVHHLTTDHAVRHPDNYLTRCIGGGQPSEDPDIAQVVLESGDALVLLTDGVWSTVADEQVAQVLARTPAQAAATRLVDLANAAGGPDNATALVVGLRAEQALPPRDVALPREEAPPAADFSGVSRRLRPPRWPWFVLALAALGILAGVLRWLGWFDAVAWLRANW